MRLKLAFPIFYIISSAVLQVCRNEKKGGHFLKDQRLSFSSLGMSRAILKKKKVKPRRILCTGRVE